jgi:hypothetical protein
MNSKEFEKLWMDQVIAMHAWASKAPDSAHRANCEHHINDMLINKSFYHHQIVVEGKAYIICKMCGKIEIPHWNSSTNEALLHHKLCFSHNHWRDIAKSKNPNILICNNHVYTDGGRQPAGTRFLGFGGREWSIAKDGKHWTTNNLWGGGLIVYDMVDQLPDNAVLKPVSQHPMR